MKKTQVKKLKLSVQNLQQLSTVQLKSAVGGRGTQGQHVVSGRNGGGYSTQIC
jgi:hypothetical protein